MIKMNNNFDYNKRIIVATIISTILMVAWVKYYGSKTLPNDYNNAVNKAEQDYQQNEQEQEIIEQKLQKCFNAQPKLAFCPERILQGKGIEEIRNLPQIVSDVNDNARSEAENLFSKVT